MRKTHLVFAVVSLLFAAEIYASEPLFSTQINYPAGRAANSIFNSDLDGDGDIDLAVANYDPPPYFPGSVSILMNTGNGTFSSAVSYGAGATSTDVHGSDLDGDGDIDLAVANYGVYPDIRGSISVLLNNGDGTFSAADNYELGEAATSVFCSDLDGDGDIDLAVTVFGTKYRGAVSVLLNNGDATFAEAVNYEVLNCSYSVHASDLDGDGDIDLAASIYDENSVSILLNAGDGTFDEAVNYGVGDTPMSVYCSDLDGDGDIDLATANYFSDNISILLNVGDGTFTPGGQYGVIGHPWSLCASDLDLDGDVDLAVADFSVSILLNDGDGTFVGAGTYGSINHPMSICGSDLDGDGDIELAVLDVSLDRVSIFMNLTIFNNICGDANGDGSLNIGDAVYLINHLLRDGPAPNPVCAGDTNGDGQTDVGDAVYIINHIFKGGAPPVETCCP